VGPSVPVVILAGGFGTRLREETEVKPKPMVDIGGRPILWHIMKIYAAFGFREFVVALGYKGEMIKEYFLHYREKASGLTIQLNTGHVEVHESEGSEDWLVHLIDTGSDTMTGGRVKRAASFLGGRRFMLTYGDGVADVDLRALLSCHERHGRLCTVTAVRPPARFGSLVFDGDLIGRFEEKPQAGEGWINGGFMVMEPSVVDYIEDDQVILERGPLERLSESRQLAVYRHEGFWQCMDHLRDLDLLRDLWNRNAAPWKQW
jgi:glucose-1-phosphate cytidylyltransferase